MSGPALPRTTWVPGVGPRPDDAWLHDVDKGLLVSVGILLFERGQGFEAHEAWELAWRDAKAEARMDDEKMLRALVKLAAAMVKVRQANAIGVRDHARGARALLESIDGEQRFGLSLEGLRALARRIDSEVIMATPVGEPMFGRLPRAR